MEENNFLKMMEHYQAMHTFPIEIIQDINNRLNLHNIDKNTLKLRQFNKLLTQFGYEEYSDQIYNIFLLVTERKIDLEDLNEKIELYGKSMEQYLVSKPKLNRDYMRAIFLEQLKIKYDV